MSLVDGNPLFSKLRRVRPITDIHNDRATTKVVGRSLHSLPTGLIKTPWIGAQAFVFDLLLGLARRFGASAKVCTKAMPYVRP